jgi:hypothetical protein
VNVHQCICSGIGVACNVGRPILGLYAISVSQVVVCVWVRVGVFGDTKPSTSQSATAFMKSMAPDVLFKYIRGFSCPQSTTERLQGCRPGVCSVAK